MASSTRSIGSEQRNTATAESRSVHRLDCEWKTPRLQRSNRRRRPSPWPPTNATNPRRRGSGPPVPRNALRQFRRLGAPTKSQISCPP
jgi:hypothetical protein